MAGEICDICKKNEGVNQIVLIMDEEKKNPYEKGISKIIGAVSACGCESCLAKTAWKGILLSIVRFLGSILVVSLLAGLIGKVFKLSWVGGGLIAVGLLINMIREIAGAERAAVKHGAVSILEQKYKKLGYIPKQDLFWITDNKEVLFENNRLNLNSPAGEISLFSCDIVEAGLKSAPDNEETVSIRRAVENCKQTAQKTGLLLLEPNIKKRMWFPVVMVLLAAAGLLVSILYMFEGGEMSSISLLITGIAEAAFTVFGVFSFAKKKVAFGYIAFAVVMACMWIGVVAFTDGGIYVEDTIILSMILLVPCLLYLPFARKN